VKKEESGRHKVHKGVWVIVAVHGISTFYPKIGLSSTDEKE
jgi:hypothetical protein